MKQLAFAILFVATPVFADEAPNYHAIDEMQEKANSYIATLEAQRNAALNQVVEITASLAKRDKECKAK